ATHAQSVAVREQKSIKWPSGENRHTQTQRRIHRSTRRKLHCDRPLWFVPAVHSSDTSSWWRRHQGHQNISEAALKTTTQDCLHYTHTHTHTHTHTIYTHKHTDTHTHKHTHSHTHTLTHTLTHTHTHSHTHTHTHTQI